VRLSERAQSHLARLHTFLVRKDSNAAKRAVLAVRDVFMPLTHAPMMGRPVEDSDDLREVVIDFGARAYLALYRYELGLETMTILSTKHQREDEYKSTGVFILDRVKPSTVLNGSDP